MTITININKEKLFSGLNNSIWLHKQSLNWKIDYLIDTEEISPTDKMSWKIDKKEYLKEIANTYCDMLTQFIDNSQWDIEKIDTNNHIILKWINPPQNAKCEDNYQEQLTTIKKLNQLFNTNDYKTLFYNNLKQTPIEYIIKEGDAFKLEQGEAYLKHLETIQQKGN